MAVVEFIATRSIAAGYTVGDTVAIQFGVMRADLTPGVISQSKISLGGARRTNVHRFEDRYRITTVPFAGTSLAVFRMFLESVRAGESFLADWESDVGPATLAYYLAKSYTPDRLFQQTFKFSFEAVQT